MYEWPDGEKYEGGFVNSKREGKGTFYYKNGDIYEGMWKNHVKDGVGIYKYQATGKEEILVYEAGKLIKQE